MPNPQPQHAPLPDSRVPAAAPARPAAPLGPVLSGAAFRPVAGAPQVASLLDAAQVRHVTSGRIAIALALREMGVGAGDLVLVPAYHSLSMIPPVLWRGATPLFYRVGLDAMVDLADIASNIGPRVKALMVTHYFGFAQDLTRLRALCDQHGIALLEDCAHALLGEHAGAPLGSYGDYAIGSSMKFYPIYEGGCLTSTRHALDGVRLRSAGAGFEAKAALAALEQAFAYGRLGWLRAALALPLALKDRLWRAVKQRRGAASSPASTLTPSSSDSSYDFDPAWIDKRASLFSRLMLRLVSRRRVGALRRRHYSRYAEALRGLPGCRALHAALPDGCYPWLFPLLVDDPEALFAKLVAGGVPVARFAETLWDGVDASVCANSARLSRSVLGLPCHQALRDDELRWIIARVQAAMA